MEWDAAWRCLVNQIIHVNSSGSGRRRWPGTTDIMTCVNVNLDIYHSEKQILPRCGACHGKDRRWQWPLPRDAARRDLHLFLLHPSVPRRGRAPDGCDRVLVQIKFREIERDGASRPAGRRDGVFGDGRGRKEVLLPQEKVTSPVMDGAWRKNPLISLRWAPFASSHPLCFFLSFFFFCCCCPFAVSWWLLGPIGEEQGVDGVSPCDPALIILFIKRLFN